MEKATRLRDQNEGRAVSTSLGPKPPARPHAKPCRRLLVACCGKLRMGAFAAEPAAERKDATIPH